MPEFKITAPDGKVYKVTGENEQGALAAVKKMVGEQQPAQPPVSGSILPFSRDANGVRFDSNAGLLGVAKRAFMLPGEVYQGKVDPTSREGINRAMELATFASPASAAARAGERAIPGITNALKKVEPKPPSARELMDTGGKQHEIFRNSGITYPVDKVAQFGETAKQDLMNKGLLDKLAPKTHAVLDEITSPPPNSVFTAANADALRQSFRNARKDFNNPQDQAAASAAVEQLDKFLVGGNATGSMAGTSADDIAKILLEGKANYAAGKRADSLARLQDAADLRASVANSGQNVGNATRSRLASLLLKPKEAGGFTTAEKGMIEDVARGSKTANLTRALGNILGGGGGLGALATGGIGATGGAFMGGPVGAFAGATIPPMVGGALKSGSARLTRKALEKVSEETRKRSPMYQKMLEDAPSSATSAEKRAAILRALIASQQAQ